MSPDDTARIVNHLISTWPTGVRGYVWTEALGSLEREMAHATYLRLRDTHRALVLPVATFLEEYRALLAARRRREAEHQAQLPMAEEPTLAPNHPRAIAAFNRGLALGAADVARLRKAHEESERQYQERRAAREEVAS